MGVFWLTVGRVFGFLWEITSISAPICAVLWAFGGPWRLSVLAALGVYIVGMIERHLLKRFGTFAVQAVFGAPSKEKPPSFKIGDVVVFDHTSSGLTAEGGHIEAIFASGRTAREMGIEPRAFEAGTTRPGAYYVIALADLKGDVEEGRIAFVALPEDMLKIVELPEPNPKSQTPNP
jgi:hypothetical protein